MTSGGAEPDFDVVVVGAGPAGAVTAYRLAELYERQATELAGIFAVETKPSATVSFVLGRNGA